MNLLNLLSPIIKNQSQKVPEDPTLYKVITQTDTYCGRISYQDNVIMWLKVADKPVKILKGNIVQITII
ncbi:MAG TPA: hypothetical protein VGQ59_12535 [Cyclobacteriaceae bacterium]|jgi:hypothetical protein|nr:hypothetical protein [Cyclobacteriaceae bacterium]